MNKFQFYFVILIALFFFGCPKTKTINIHNSKASKALITNCPDRIQKIEIKREIDKNIKKIYSCYKAALKANPQLEGKIIYEWEINDKGEVGRVNIVESSVNSIGLENCNMEILKAIKYKPLGNGCWAKARYPFHYDLVKNQ